MVPPSKASHSSKGPLFAGSLSAGPASSIAAASSPMRCAAFALAASCSGVIRRFSVSSSSSACAAAGAPSAASSCCLAARGVPASAARSSSTEAASTPAAMPSEAPAPMGSVWGPSRHWLGAST
eukprot:2332724-Prymnesium_polylepis.1